MAKSGPFALNPPHKTQFLAHFMAKGGPFGRFGVLRRTPPGYEPDLDKFIITYWLAYLANSNNQLVLLLCTVCLYCLYFFYMLMYLCSCICEKCKNLPNDMLALFFKIYVYDIKEILGIYFIFIYYKFYYI